MYWPPVASVVKVLIVCRFSGLPFRRMIVTGVEVSFVAYVMACGSPSVTGFGTRVKLRTSLCAAAKMASAPSRSAFEKNMLAVAMVLSRLSLANNYEKYRAMWLRIER